MNRLPGFSAEATLREAKRQQYAGAERFGSDPNIATPAVYYEYGTGIDKHIIYCWDRDGCYACGSY